MNIKLTAPFSKSFGLLKLLRLTSSSLPIGSFSYSQGLEYAVSRGWVKDSSTALDWIQGLMKNSLLHLEIPIFKRVYKAFEENEEESTQYWNAYLMASRDSYELQEEDRQQGKALARLLVELGLKEKEVYLCQPYGCFLTTFSLAAVRWEIPLEDSVNGFLWMWAENQVLSATKLIPLGQTEGQKILSELIEIIPHISEKGLALDDEEIGYTAFGLGMASALHETQYTRLFRS